MEKIFHIEENISEETVQKFKSFLKIIEHNETIRLHLNSWGGNSGAGKRIEGYIYYMKKYKSCIFITEAKIAASAAFRIFIRGNKRIITEESIVQIHLPVPNIPNISPKLIAIERKKDIYFITNTIPCLTAEEVIKYDDLPLSIDFMLKKNIATEVVQSF